MSDGPKAPCSTLWMWLASIPMIAFDRLSSAPSAMNSSLRHAGAAARTATASEKTLLVLEAALTHSRFTEVVEATGLAKATAHRILTTLI